MEIFQLVSELEDRLHLIRSKDKRLGFVPTMGALHKGHAELIKRCVKNNDFCIVSIFVNPTQFNNKEDLILYPRTLNKDLQLLEDIGVDIVFTPSENEMYPEPDDRIFDFGQLDKVMEGSFRPGHFNGVAQIVSKLFQYIQPDRVYFGEKDFQQFAIVKSMVDQLKLNIEIVPVPTVRESSGLAMSSRNQRLSFDQKKSASEIYRVLQKSKTKMHNFTPAQAADYVVKAINDVPELSVEYFEIVDGNSLKLTTSWFDSNYIVGCIAVLCGDVRLIDNIRYK